MLLPKLQPPKMYATRHATSVQHTLDVGNHSSIVSQKGSYKPPTPVDIGTMGNGKYNPVCWGKLIFMKKL